MNGFLPTIETLKSQAKRLRVALKADGRQIGHGDALELLARQHGYRDWNTLHAAIGNQMPPHPLFVGERVRGQYLGQAFDGEVKGLSVLATPGRYRVTFEFDEAVDVVAFDSFSNFRKRVSCIIDRAGVTMEKTSDGRPHLQVHLS